MMPSRHPTTACKNGILQYTSCIGHYVVAVPAMPSLISSFALSHICTCFGLCSSLGGHVCGDSYGRAKL